MFRWLHINGHIVMEISAKVNFHLAKGKKGAEKYATNEDCLVHLYYYPAVLL